MALKGSANFGPRGSTALGFGGHAHRAFPNTEGSKIVEATWMAVAAFKSEKVCIDSLTRGSLVHLTGRLRNNKYIDSAGCERVFTEVIADSLEVLE